MPLGRELSYTLFFRVLVAESVGCAVSIIILERINGSCNELVKLIFIMFGETSFKAFMSVVELTQ